MNRCPLLAVLLAALLSACSEPPERSAGGDDMGNFLQARLLDSTGSPVAGRVQVVSDVDTVSLDLDPDGELLVPGRVRSWMIVRAASGAYILDAPPSVGRVGDWKLGRARPLVGWTKSGATFAIAGLGVARRDGGYFRFPAVPPGRTSLRATSDSFRVSLPLDLELDRISARRGSSDSLVLAPLVAGSTGLVVAPRSDTSGCGTGCPRWFYDLDNTVLGELPAYREVAPDLDTTFGESTLVASVLRSEARGDWILFDLLLRGASAVPVFRADTAWVPTGADTSLPRARMGFVFVAARLANDSMVSGPADALTFHRVALRRTVSSWMSDSLQLQGAVFAWIPRIASLASESCTRSGSDSTRSTCGPPGREWILVR